MSHALGKVSAQDIAYADKINRILALQKRLEHMPLSEFTPNDLPALFRIMDHRASDPTDKELDQIEQKLDNMMFAP